MITSAVRCIETAFARCNKDWEGPILYHRLRTLISSAEAMKAKKQQCAIAATVVVVVMHTHLARNTT